MVKDAKSATNVYSYAYSFCGRAVVATFDLSAQNLGELESDHWLCNRDNVRLLKLNETAYVEPADMYLDSPPAHAAQRKRRWIVFSPLRGPVSGSVKPFKFQPRVEGPHRKMGWCPPGNPLQNKLTDAKNMLGWEC